MVQTLIVFFFIAICSLVFSKAESVTYVDGIYFTVVSMLTIGFGDLTPRTPIMKVLTFPFVIIGIALLALVVTSIVRLLEDRARRRKLQMKKRLKQMTREKKKRHQKESGSMLQKSMSLQEELLHMRNENWESERRANLRSMATGIIVFVMFWFIGALIFCQIEVHFYLKEGE